MFFGDLDFNKKKQQGGQGGGGGYRYKTEASNYDDISKFLYGGSSLVESRIVPGYSEKPTFQDEYAAALERQIQEKKMKSQSQKRQKIEEERKMLNYYVNHYPYGGERKSNSPQRGGYEQQNNFAAYRITDPSKPLVAKSQDYPGESGVLISLLQNQKSEPDKYRQNSIGGGGGGGGGGATSNSYDPWRHLMRNPQNDKQRKEERLKEWKKTLDEQAKEQKLKKQREMERKRQMEIKDEQRILAELQELRNDIAGDNKKSKSQKYVQKREDLYPYQSISFPTNQDDLQGGYTFGDNTKKNVSYAPDYNKDSKRENINFKPVYEKSTHYHYDNSGQYAVPEYRHGNYSYNPVYQSNNYLNNFIDGLKKDIQDSQKALSSQLLQIKAETVRTGRFRQVAEKNLLSVSKPYMMMRTGRADNLLDMRQVNRSASALKLYKKDGNEDQFGAGKNLDMYSSPNLHDPGMRFNQSTGDLHNVIGDNNKQPESPKPENKIDDQGGEFGDDGEGDDEERDNDLPPVKDDDEGEHQSQANQGNNHSTLKDQEEDEQTGQNQGGQEQADPQMSQGNNNQADPDINNNANTDQDKRSSIKSIQKETIKKPDERVFEPIGIKNTDQYRHSPQFIEGQYNPIEQQRNQEPQQQDDYLATKNLDFLGNMIEEEVSKGKSSVFYPNGTEHLKKPRQLHSNRDSALMIDSQIVSRSMAHPNQSVIGREFEHKLSTDQNLKKDPIAKLDFVIDSFFQQNDGLLQSQNISQ